MSPLLSSSGILSCSFLWNIFLCCLILPILCFYFHVFDRLIIVTNLGEVASCRRRPMGPTSILPSVHQSYML